MIEAMKQWLEALENVEALIEHQYTGTREAMSYLQNTADDAQEALTSLRAVIEQAEKQEPVAWVHKAHKHVIWFAPVDMEAANLSPLYPAPAQPTHAIHPDNCIWKRNGHEACTTAQPVQDRCAHCDDTGDVHSIDGQWRGKCICKSTQPALKPLSEHYEALEPALENLVNVCNNSVFMSTTDEVISAEAALERLHKARKAANALKEQK